MKTLFAWLVHLYTAMGLVCAAGIAVLVVHGGDTSFRRAFVLMMIATAIDASDGWFARRARVKEVLPMFDGAALDNLIDFLTYTSLPLLLLWRAQIPPAPFAWLLVVPLLASAYGFSRVDAGSYRQTINGPPEEQRAAGSKPQDTTNDVLFRTLTAVLAAG